MNLLFSPPKSGAALLFLTLAGPAVAADHNEADGTKADHVADLDDVYAWHTSDGKIVAVVTFGGPGADASAVLEGLDDGVVYGIHVDDDGDYVADHDIWVRFGQNGAGAWGVQFEGIPGGTATVSGPIQTEIDAGSGLRAIAGVFDDPFFFDFTGLQDTLATGAVSFQATRDSFAGKNVNAIVLEMSTAAATGGAANVNLWATTGRK
jgi:hypothetical protein